MSILPGLKFVIKFNLHPKELELFMILMEKPYSCAELALKTKKNPTTIYTVLSRLRYKRVVNLDSKNEAGTNFYKALISNDN